MQLGNCLVSWASPSWERVWWNVHIHRVPMLCMMYSQHWSQVCSLSLKLLSLKFILLWSSTYSFIVWTNGMTRLRESTCPSFVPMVVMWWSKPWVRYVATSKTSAHMSTGSPQPDSLDPFSLSGLQGLNCETRDCPDQLTFQRYYIFLPYSTVWVFWSR